jgi:hypothetical protein
VVRTSLLPPAARRRIAAARESALWSAPVSPAEETALRSVGFEPAGVVTASIPSWPFAYQLPASVRSAAARTGAVSPSRRAYGTYLDDALTAKRAGGFTRDYIEGTYGGLIPDTGFSWQRVVGEARERQLVRAVIDCLRTQAEGLGGHGIVSIRLSWRHRPDLDFGELEVHDVNAVGLAVRASNSSYRGDPFTAATSGREVCALLRSGLAPSRLVFGVGIVKADMGNRTRRHMRSVGLAEVGQFSEAIQKSLSLATADLETSAVADGEVISGSRPTVIFNRIVGAGLEAHVRIVGTVLRRFRSSEQVDILPILRLSDRPRSS